MDESHSIFSAGCLKVGQGILIIGLEKQHLCHVSFPRCTRLPRENKWEWGLKNSIIFVTVPGEMHNISVDDLNTCKLAILEHMAKVSKKGVRCTQPA